MCHEPAMKVDILQDATFLSITSKVPEHAFLHRVTDIEYKKRKKGRKEGTERLRLKKKRKRTKGPAVVTAIQSWKCVLCTGF